MPLEIRHNVARGVERLLNAPKDIEGGTPVPDRVRRIGESREELQKLFEHYRKGYEFFYPHAERWWKGCVAAAEGEGRTHQQAVDIAFENRLAGPASVGEVVWFVRYFWLRCDNVNKSLPFEDRVAPQDVLLRWLVDGEDDEYVALLTCMPYWPIGLDEHGAWC